MNKLTLVTCIIVILFFVSMSGISAASSIGTSTITLSANSVTIPQGSSTTVGYKVALSSGTTWGTTISASAPSGISVSFSDPEGDPTFTGTATISVSSSLSPGQYTLTFKATGDDPSTNSPSLTVNVTAVQNVSGKSSISVSATTISLKGTNSTAVSYYVNLSSGTSGLTELKYSSSGGLIVSFSNASGNPPFNGKITVTGSSSTTTGTYHILIYATGADPSTSNVSIDVNYVSTQQPSSNIPFIAGAIVIIAGIVIFILGYLYSGRRLEYVQGGTVAITSLLSLYLIIFDSSLRNLAPDHFYGLILFLVLSLAAYIISRTNSEIGKISKIGLFAGSLIFALLMLSDVFFGLPVSSSHNLIENIGWNYLFGFGTNSISTFSISLAFSLLFISVTLLSSLSLNSYVADKKSQ